MEWSEFELHSAVRQLKKVIAQVMVVRKHLFNAQKPAKFAAGHNDTTKAIEQNIDALIQGSIETQNLCAIAINQFKGQMKEPDATPPPEHAFTTSFLTPFQRQLQKEGVVFGKDTFTPKKPAKSPPRILPFRLNQPKRKNRRSSPDNPPL